MRAGRAPYQALITATACAALVAACTPPAPTLRSGSPAPPSAVSTPAAPLPTPSPTPTAIPTPIPSLPTLTNDDFGGGQWTIISTETNESGIARVEILGNVQTGFAWVFTCVGEGDARFSLAGAGGSVPPPPATPMVVVSTTYSCATTEGGVHLTGQFDHAGVSISPNVDADPGVVYRVIVGTSSP